MMDWNIKSSPGSSLQVENFEFQGLHLEQQFPAAGGFSQDHTSTQNPCTYPGNNQIINIPSSTIITNKLPLQNTGGCSALKPIRPKTMANKGFDAPKQLNTMLPLSVSTVCAQMTPGVTQNSNLIRNVPTSSCVVLPGSTINSVQNIPQKRVNTYMAMENNQSHQIGSKSVRTAVYQRASKNNSSPKSQPIPVSYYYVNGPPISQAGATMPFNSSSNHYLNPQQNFSYAVLPVGQNRQNQINGQNSSMTVTMQSQQYVSDHVNRTPYNVPTHCHNRNLTQVSPYTVPTQVPNKNPPPPYPVTPVPTSYGQFSLTQPVANISNENVQNYYRPVPDVNITSYSAHCGPMGQSVQITRETNAMGSVAYNVSEHGSENQLSDLLTKSSVEFRESLLNSVQAARTVSADEALTSQTSQTLEPQKNVLGNFPANSPKSNLKITKESLALDYKKIHQAELALLKFAEAFKRKWKIFLSAKENQQVSDPSAQNQNLNRSSPCNITQNEPSHDVNRLQVPLHDASQNKSFSPASCDSNQIKNVSLLPQKVDSHLLPILRSLLEGTTDENMLFNACFGNEVTHQNKQVAVESSSSSLSVSNGDKYEYNVNNTDSSLRPSPQVSQMNSTQEPLPYTKNDLGLMQNSKSANHQVEKISAASAGDLFHRLTLNKGALEAIRSYVNQSLQSLVQSPTDSYESSLPANEAVKENSQSSHHSQSTCPILMQKPEKIIKTGSEYVSDASSSASVVSKKVVVGQEAGTIQKHNPNPTVLGDSFRNRGICSLEELKACLALWKKNLPASLSGQLCESTQSTIGFFSSENGEDDKKPQQSLENLTNVLTQNEQAKAISRSDEITQSSVPITIGKNHDVASSNMSKGSEPQVAIVTPLMLSKDNVQIAVQKNSPSLEITYPASEEGRVHSLQKLFSTVPNSDKEMQGIICSPSESINHSKDLGIDQKAVISTQENGIVKVETVENGCYELSQVIDNHTQELKNLKSQFGSGNNIPPDNHVSQNLVQSQTGLDLLEVKNADEVEQNDTALQISSVCTLVKGDAFYNSQIASIFTTSPLKSSMENETSLNNLMPYLQCNDQKSGILKTEPESEVNTSVSERNALVPLPSPYILSKAVEETFKGVQDVEMTPSHKTSEEMNGRQSGEIKSSHFPEGTPFSEKKLEQNVSCSGVYSTDFVSDNQQLCQNKGDQFNSSTSDGLCAVNKEKGTVESVLAEENKHSVRSTEVPVTLLSDQLTELSKEFPYGIGYLKTLNVMGNNDPVPNLNDRGNKENVQISEKYSEPSGAIDQIKIVILDSQQMKEVFPEQKQQISKKSENSEDGYLKTDSKDKLTKESISLIKTDEAIDVEAGATSSETALKRREHTYCCLRGWIASEYAVELCPCMLAKESGSGQKVDLCSHSETVVKHRPKANDNCNVDFRLNCQLPSSTLDTTSEKVSSGTESYRTLNKISGHTDANEHKSHRVDQPALPLESLEKLNLQKSKQTNEHIRKELPHQASSQSIKAETETIEIDMSNDYVQARENSSTDKAQFPNSEHAVVARNLCKTNSSSKQKSEKVVVKSKIDTVRHRYIEIKRSTNYERYKIKRDSSETHMIKGPLRKGLKRQKAMERKRKALAIQCNDGINASNLISVGSFSRKCENPQYASTSHSQEHLNGNFFRKIKDLEKRYGYKKVEHKEPSYSEHTEHHSYRTEHRSDCTKPSIKRINLEKYAYSKDRKNAWKCRSSHVDNSKTLTPQKQRVRKLSISLQRETKNAYLNRVAFTRIAHKTISLTNLEPSYSKSVWRVKSSSPSGWSKDKRKSSSSPQQPEAEKPPMLQFKMCPDILFRDPVTEEEIVDAKKLPEKDKAPVTAVKSKREDWLNYAPVKRRKTEENEAQVDDEIPLDTAIKLLDKNDTFGMPPKDSQTTFETYKKMHLEKRSRSLDSSPLC